MAVRYPSPGYRPRFPLQRIRFGGSVDERNSVDPLALMASSRDVLIRVHCNQLRQRGTDENQQTQHKQQVEHDGG